MLFNSYVFLFAFLPFTLIGFHALSHFFGAKAAKYWLITASLIYYGWWSPPNVLLILASMAFNFGIGRLMGRPGARAKVLLVFGIAVNLLLLGYFKYANFFVDNVDVVFGAHWTLRKIILPLGISFFTFQQVTYLVDASRGVGREYNPADYVLFISFFPHSIAGPIVHHQEMMPQFARPDTYRFNWENIAVGLTLLAGGLFKKLMMADTLSVASTRVFDAAASGAPLSASDAWAGPVCYTFQIYFDFSGYSDMALGLARMFGITLPLNFNSPYKAASCVEFWHRWHMTLSRCLRDYLYIPLGGNRLGKPRQYVNLVLTMLIGGIWHGAGWTFVAWGLYHGACLCVNHVWLQLKNAFSTLSRLPPGAWYWLSRAMTFLVVILGWVLFRAATLHAAANLLAAMFHCGVMPISGAPTLVKNRMWFWLIGATTFVWTAPNLEEMLHKYKPALNPFRGELPVCAQWISWTPTIKWACVVAGLLIASILSLSNTSEFLYFNF